MKEITNKSYHQLYRSNHRIKWSNQYWAYRHKWNESHKHGFLKRVPLHLDVEATTKCQLKCIMCPRTDQIKAGSFRAIKDFNLSRYISLIDEFAEKGGYSIKYNILGEPLLNKNLVRMIKHASRRNLVDIMFNTNVLALTEELASDLITSGLTKIFFSVDSPDKESYESIRIGSDFDKVLRNIKMFYRTRENLKSSYPLIRLSCIKFDESDEDKINRIVDIFSPFVDEIGYVNYMEHGLRSKSKPKKGWICPQLWQRMFIHPDGLVTPCCIDSDRTLVMGNINEKSIEEIWLSKEYLYLRHAFTSGTYNKIPICSNCHLMEL